MHSQPCLRWPHRRSPPLALLARPVWNSFSPFSQQAETTSESGRGGPPHSLSSARCKQAARHAMEGQAAAAQGGDDEAPGRRKAVAMRLGWGPATAPLARNRQQQHGWPGDEHARAVHGLSLLRSPALILPRLRSGRNTSLGSRYNDRGPRAARKRGADRTRKRGERRKENSEAEEEKKNSFCSALPSRLSVDARRDYAEEKYEAHRILSLVERKPLGWSVSIAIKCDRSPCMRT